MFLSHHGTMAVAVKPWNVRNNAEYFQPKLFELHADRVREDNRCHVVFMSFKMTSNFVLYNWGHFPWQCAPSADDIFHAVLYKLSAVLGTNKKPIISTYVRNAWQVDCSGFKFLITRKKAVFFALFENETRRLHSSLFQSDPIHDGHGNVLDVLSQELSVTLHSCLFNAPFLCEVHHEFGSNSTKIPKRWLAGLNSLRGGSNGQFLWVSLGFCSINSRTDVTSASQCMPQHCMCFYFFRPSLLNNRLIRPYASVPDFDVTNRK